MYIKRARQTLVPIRRAWPVALLVTATLILVACASMDPVSNPPNRAGQPVTWQPAHHFEQGLLAKVNAEINRLGKPCLDDYCNPDWPLSEELAKLEYWDCKARAVAKADRLIRQYGFAEQRLAYVVIKGPRLRIAHTALLVDGDTILDNGTICAICHLDKFTHGATLEGILPVADLAPMLKAYRLAHPKS